MRGIDFEKRITVEPLGEITVRTLSYTARRQLFDNLRGEQSEDDDQYQSELMLNLLSVTVTDSEGVPCGTPEDWNLFAGRHTNEAMEVFKVACELNGFQPEVIEKN